MKIRTTSRAAAFAFAALLAAAPAAFADCPEVGDLDGDGVITVLDLQELEQIVLGVLQGDPAPEGADLNGDGAVNVTDVVWFAMFLLPDAKGDMNGDGAIDVIDLQAWMVLWHSSRGYYAPADLNCDGKVDVVDFQILILVALAAKSM